MGVFSRKSATGNEKSLHSAPHHNRPSHTTVTIKWTFFWDKHNPNSTRTPQHLTLISSPPHTIPLPITYPSHSPHLPLVLHSALITYRSQIQLSQIQSTPLSHLSYLFSLSLLTHTYSLYTNQSHSRIPI